MLKAVEESCLDCFLLASQMTQQQTYVKAVTIDKPQGSRHSIAKEVGPLSCTRRYFNGIVLNVEVNNLIMQKIRQRRAKFRFIKVFIKHAHELTV